MAIWLPEGYPRSSPIVYVVPTPDMIIKPNHSFVDRSGIVNSPYMQNWAGQRSSLVDMCHDAGIMFGQDPPLFSKPPGDLHRKCRSADCILCLHAAVLHGELARGPAWLTCAMTQASCLARTRRCSLNLQVMYTWELLQYTLVFVL